MTESLDEKRARVRRLGAPLGLADLRRFASVLREHYADALETVEQDLARHDVSDRLGLPLAMGEWDRIDNRDRAYQIRALRAKHEDYSKFYEFANALLELVNLEDITRSAVDFANYIKSQRR